MLGGAFQLLAGQTSTPIRVHRRLHQPAVGAQAALRSGSFAEQAAI